MYHWRASNIHGRHSLRTGVWQSWHLNRICHMLHRREHRGWTAWTWDLFCAPQRQRGEWIVHHLYKCLVESILSLITHSYITYKRYINHPERERNSNEEVRWTNTCTEIDVFFIHWSISTSVQKSQPPHPEATHAPACHFHRRGPSTWTVTMMIIIRQRQRHPLPPRLPIVRVGPSFNANRRPPEWLPPPPVLPLPIRNQ